jgi:hypothetical protein
VSVLIPDADVSMTLDNVREICDCGHDKATHHFDVRGPGDCLGMRCECLGFHRPGTKPLRLPPPPPKPRRRWGWWP